MKLFGRFLLAFFQLLGYYPIIQAQQVTIFESSKQSIVRYINSNNLYDYNYSVIHQIGRDDGNNGIRSASTEDIWRTEHSFDLSQIQSNWNITKASLVLLLNGYSCNSCTVKVTKTSGGQSWGNLWSGINNTDVIISTFSYSSSTNTVESSALKDVINAARPGTLYLGSLSLNENSNQTYSSVELRLVIEYTVTSSNVTFTADNSFVNTGGANHGTMSIDGGQPQTVPLSGISITRLTGTSLQLGANSPQNDNQGHQIIWHTGGTNTSNWTRNGEYRWPNQTYSFPVAADDNGKRYVANLRKNYRIDQTHNSEFDGSLTQQNTSYIVEQNNGNITAPSTKSFNGKTYSFAYWTDGITGNTRNETPTDNTTYTAFYKYPAHSSTSLGYDKDGQRKVVFGVGAYDAGVWKVYESSGNVWLEKDGVVVNGGAPVNILSDGPKLNLLQWIMLYQVPGTQIFL